MDYEVALGNSTKEMLSIIEIVTVVVVIIVMVVARIQSTRNLQRVFRLYSVRHHSVSLNSQKVISRHHSLRAIMKMNLTI